VHISIDLMALIFGIAALVILMICCMFCWMRRNTHDEFTKDGMIEIAPIEGIPHGSSHNLLIPGAIEYITPDLEDPCPGYVYRYTPPFNDRDTRNSMPILTEDASYVPGAPTLMTPNHTPGRTRNSSAPILIDVHHNGPENRLPKGKRDASISPRKDDFDGFRISKRDGMDFDRTLFPPLPGEGEGSGFLDVYAIESSGGEPNSISADLYHDEGLEGNQRVTGKRKRSELEDDDMRQDSVKKEYVHSEEIEIIDDTSIEKAADISVSLVIITSDINEEAKKEELPREHLRKESITIIVKNEEELQKENLKKAELKKEDVTVIVKKEENIKVQESNKADKKEDLKKKAEKQKVEKKKPEKKKRERWKPERKKVEKKKAERKIGGKKKPGKKIADKMKAYQKKPEKKKPRKKKSNRKKSDQTLEDARKNARPVE